MSLIRDCALPVRLRTPTVDARSGNAVNDMMRDGSGRHLGLTARISHAESQTLLGSKLMLRVARLLALVLAIAASGCAPPELTAAQEELVRRCLELAYKQEDSPECAQQATKPMLQAFHEKHPEFQERLLAERKAFVEARIAEDMRRRDELNLCLDHREAGNVGSPGCEKFMTHEIARGLEDRRRRRCAAARLDGKADAQPLCEGLAARDIEEEVQMERTRRARKP
jgi:hypothetical protein